MDRQNVIYLNTTKDKLKNAQCFYYYSTAITYYYLICISFHHHTIFCCLLTRRNCSVELFTREARKNSCTEYHNSVGDLLPLTPIYYLPFKHKHTNKDTSPLFSTTELSPTSLSLFSVQYLQCIFYHHHDHQLSASLFFFYLF